MSQGKIEVLKRYRKLPQLPNKIPRFQPWQRDGVEGLLCDWIVLSNSELSLSPHEGFIDYFHIRRDAELSTSMHMAVMAPFSWQKKKTANRSRFLFVVFRCCFRYFGRPPSWQKFSGYVFVVPRRTRLQCKFNFLLLILTISCWCILTWEAFDFFSNSLEKSCCNVYWLSCILFDSFCFHYPLLEDSYYLYLFLMNDWDDSWCY